MSKDCARAVSGLAGRIGRNPRAVAGRLAGHASLVCKLALLWTSAAEILAALTDWTGKGATGVEEPAVG